MKLQLVGALVLAGALAGCHSNAEKVQEERKDVAEARQEANKEVADAQAKAVKNINDEKEEGARDIQKQEADLRKAEADAARSGTTSGATSGIIHRDSNVQVSPETCARFAVTKDVKPEDRALYDACSHMKKDDLRK